LKLERETFKRIFPNLAKELGSDNNKINPVRTDDEAEERHVGKRRFVYYVPDVIDFIRRCDKRQQAEEIVNYMEKKGEISRLCAQKLKRQLREKGVRSFGFKKEENYYLKHGEL
jgi:hypothetical protein